MTVAPTQWTYDIIGHVAEEVGRSYGIYDQAGRADIDLLIQQIGAEVVTADDYDMREASHVDENGKLTILLPRFTSDRRDRFTTAHELGHFFVHYLAQRMAGPAQFARGGRGTAETQANVFAASLLMPADAFREQYRAHDGDAWKLSTIFGVSPAAANVRAQVLKLGS